MLQLSIDERRRNFAFLQAVADAVGREVETRSYDDLLRPAADLAFKQTVDGAEVDVAVVTKRRESDGTLTVRVGVSSALPLPLGAPPAYVFHMRRDGKVY